MSGTGGSVVLPNGAIVARPTSLDARTSAYLEALTFSANNDAIRAEIAAQSIDAGAIQDAIDAANVAAAAAAAATVAANTATATANATTTALATKVSKTGDTITGYLEISTSGALRFGHPNQSSPQDGVIGAAAFFSGLNIVGVQTASGEGRVINVFGKTIFDTTPEINTSVANPNHVANKSYVDSAAGQRLALVGGAMTGFVTLHANPTTGAHASNKTYVDAGDAAAVSSATGAAAASADSLYLARTGGNMTGFITLHANPTTGAHASNKTYVDAGDTATLSAATGAAASSAASLYLARTGGAMTGFVTLHANPTDGNHASNKAYVDAAFSAIGSSYLSTGGGTLTGPLTINANLGVSGSLGVTTVNAQSINTGDVSLNSVYTGSQYYSQILKSDVGGYINFLQMYHTPSVETGVAFAVGFPGSYVTWKMTNTGNAFAVNGAWVDSSDGRVKKNQRDITNALSKVSKLMGKTFWRADSPNMGDKKVYQAGLIAQEVRAVLPEAVEFTGPPPDCDPEGEDFLAMNYNAVTALLVNAINELAARVIQLENSHV